VPLHRPRADEQFGPDLRVRAAAAGEPGDLGLLRREFVSRLDAAFADGLAGGGSSRRARSANPSMPIVASIS
jgi:hypothetical protein